MDFLNFLRANWDRTAGWACIASGALLLCLGWVGVSGTSYVFEQIPYVTSGAIGGLFLLGLGATLLLSGDMRDEWRKLDAIEDRLSRGTSLAGTDAVVFGPGCQDDAPGIATSAGNGRRCSE